MVHNIKSVNALLVVLFSLNLSHGTFSFQNIEDNESQLKTMIASIEGLENEETELLQQQIELQFKDITRGNKLDENILNSIKSIISAGIFEEASFDKISKVAHIAYIAEMNGAPADYVEDLALIGFSYDISQDQLEMAAKSISKLLDNDIEPSIVEELTAYCIYNGWDGKIIEAVSDGLIDGSKKGLDPRKLTLAIIIGVDQRKEGIGVNEIVAECIQFLENVQVEDSEESVRRDTAFRYLQKAKKQNIPNQIAEEMFVIAISENWTAEVIATIYDGLIQGQEDGLTTEKLATAFIVRMAQGSGNVNVHDMVREEIKYVRQLEQRKVDLVKADQKKYKRTQIPIDQNTNTNIQPKKFESKRQDTPVTYYPVTKRSGINVDLMKQTIEQFLGPPATPYRWGGNSLQGTDCSGFAQSIYRIQGIYLPRTSRQQATIGIPVPSQNIKFGDLVFFSKYFNNFITHVGIYIGNNRFVHASCSKGVMISSLTKAYYRTRFRGAKRVVY